MNSLMPVVSCLTASSEFHEITRKLRSDLGWYGEAEHMVARRATFFLESLGPAVVLYTIETGYCGWRTLS